MILFTLSEQKNVDLYLLPLLSSGVDLIFSQLTLVIFIHMCNVNFLNNTFFFFLLIIHIDLISRVNNLAGYSLPNSYLGIPLSIFVQYSLQYVLNFTYYFMKIIKYCIQYILFHQLEHTYQTNSFPFKQYCCSCSFYGASLWLLSS